MNNERNKSILLGQTAEEETYRNTSHPINYVSLAKYCFQKYGFEKTPMQRYYMGKWYSFNGKGFEQLSGEEADQSVNDALTHHPELNVTVSSDLRHEVLSTMQTPDLCGLSARKYQMPCWLSTGEDASRILLMKNGYVSIDKIMDTMKAGRPRPKTKWTTPDLFSTWTKGYDYISTAKCTKFLKFLKEIQPNKANREALQKMAGICLIPNCTYEKAFVLCGIAGSGKTTFLKILKAMLGKNCYCSIPLSQMPDVSNGTLLTEKLVNISSDMSLGMEQETVEVFLKTVASGEEIAVLQPDGSKHMTNAKARCIFETNTLPRFSDKSNAVWDRLYPIPFSHVFRGTAKQNPHLADELIAQELPGVLNWALEGLFKVLQQKTFPLTEESRNALVNWRIECDPVGAYIMDRIEINPDGRVFPGMTYYWYKVWMEKHGIRSFSVEETEFMKTLLRMYPTAHIEERILAKKDRQYLLRGIAYQKEH